MFEKPDYDTSPFQLILIYINEAHTEAWPIGGLPLYDPTDPGALRSSVPHGPGQTSFEDRVANMGALASKLPATLKDCISWAVDTWCDPCDFGSPTFENVFHAWPDRFVRLDKDDKIVDISVYGNQDEENAVLVNDYAASL